MRSRSTARLPEIFSRNNRTANSRCTEDLLVTGISREGGNMATKERLAAMAASLCARWSGAIVITLVEADPSDNASELRTYVCAGCGHTQTYSVAAGNG